MKRDAFKLEPEVEFLDVALRFEARMPRLVPRFPDSKPALSRLVPNPPNLKALV